MNKTELTLYDHYAAAALTGLLAGPMGSDTRGMQRAIEKAKAKDAIDLLAINAHDLADAMMKRRPVNEQQ